MNREQVIIKAKLSICQIYHGKNKLQLVQWDDDVRFVLDQHN